MSTEWDDLARLAEAATPGPWEVDDDDCGYASPDAPMVATPWVGGRRTHIVGSPARPHGKPLPENAEFIAAANPATILRLITGYRAWQEEASEALGKVATWEQVANRIAAERDALRARLAAVEALADEWEGSRNRLTYLVAVYLHECAADLRAALAAPTDTTKETP